MKPSLRDSEGGRLFDPLAARAASGRARWYGRRREDVEEDEVVEAVRA